MSERGDLEMGDEYLIFTERGCRTGKFDPFNNCFWMTDCTHPAQNAFLPYSAAKCIVCISPAHLSRAG